MFNLFFLFTNVLAYFGDKGLFDHLDLEAIQHGRCVLWLDEQDIVSAHLWQSGACTDLP